MFAFQPYRNFNLKSLNKSVTELAICEQSHGIHIVSWFNRVWELIHTFSILTRRICVFMSMPDVGMFTTTHYTTVLW